MLSWDTKYMGNIRAVKNQLKMLSQDKEERVRVRNKKEDCKCNSSGRRWSQILEVKWKIVKKIWKRWCAFFKHSRSTLTVCVLGHTVMLSMKDGDVVLLEICNGIFLNVTRLHLQCTWNQVHHYSWFGWGLSELKLSGEGWESHRILTPVMISWNFLHINLTYGTTFTSLKPYWLV